LRAARIAGLVLLAALAGASEASADDKADIESILNEQVVSTASTTAQRASVAPSLSTTITSEDIQALGIRTLAEAINFLSVGVITTDPLRTPDIGSRGVLFPNDDGKHFLLLVNGHAINDPLYGAARFDEGAGVPIDLIDRLEIVVGPGSVLYGSNAMMGVVNVITKSAASYEGGHLLGDFEVGRSYRLGAGLGARFRLFGADSEITAAFEYYGGYGPTYTFPLVSTASYGGALFGNVSWGQGLPRATWGGPLHSAIFAQAPSALVRLRSGDFEVNLSGNLYRRGIPYSSSYFEVQFDDPSSYELDRSLRLDIKHSTSLSAVAQLSSRAYADSFDYQRRLDQSGLGGCLSSLPVCEYYDAGVAQWAGLEERLGLNWLRDHSLVTTVGIDGRIRWVGTKEDQIDPSTGRAIGATEGRINSMGSVVSPYAEQTYSPTSWLDFNAGARLDIDNRYSPVLSPRGAVAIRPLEKTTLKVVYSQAFRSPGLAETSTVDYKVFSAPGLQPETVRSLEASIEQRFGSQRVLFGVFRSWWENLIEATPVTGAELASLQAQHLVPAFLWSLVQNKNIASVENYGWNGAWDGTLADRRLRFGASVTGAFTRLEQGGQTTVPVVAPQVFGNARVGYVLGERLPTASLALYWMGPRTADRTTVSGATLPEAPALADVRASLVGRVPGIHAVGYSLTADYISAASGPYMAGPDFNVFQAFTGFGAAPAAAYVPIDQFRVMAGLRLDFLDNASAGKGEP
jgi:outer membrane receptor protein involved in Fe transport